MIWTHGQNHPVAMLPHTIISADCFRFDGVVVVVVLILPCLLFNFDLNFISFIVGAIKWSMHSVMSEYVHM